MKITHFQYPTPTLHQLLKQGGGKIQVVYAKKNNNLNTIIMDTNPLR